MIMFMFVFLLVVKYFCVVYNLLVRHLLKIMVLGIVTIWNKFVEILINVRADLFVYWNSCKICSRVLSWEWYNPLTFWSFKEKVYIVSEGYIFELHFHTKSWYSVMHTIIIMKYENLHIIKRINPSNLSVCNTALAIYPLPWPPTLKSLQS